ncbi:MAG: N-linked glycosylation glycosyltransferase PglG [uncultured Sulfurovum sp.]|uniref:N-linked glycosylation glycosyltransferase PglG n=1 Tax=uncultured Sulfurovum sp. TaxID=269237 RepID=A0A6S6T5V4_9BACT|nr:MAG: N-linked glycosylation glycosyltransferase PglG [uncultured Sulfurovum sp.]
MVVREIQEYAEVRTKARAYLCFIMSRNISNMGLTENNLDAHIGKQLKDLKDALPQAEVFYAIGADGVQVSRNVSKNKKLNDDGKGSDRSGRAYFYKTLAEERCVLTDPYPSLTTNNMVVTASFPVYDDDGHNNLLYILCVDICLENILKMVHPSSVDSTFGMYSKLVYACFSFALLLVSLLLFVKGVSSFLHLGMHVDSIDINEMFKATILLTLALAIFDLVKAIFEEEVLGKEKKEGAGDGHQTMIRFLGSIIIALSIEALMLVFKFAITEPEKLVSAVYLILGVTALMIGLSIYIHVNKAQINKLQK